jgi:superfamily I DNA/RNA helicase
MQGDGICEILEFPNEKLEAQYLLKTILGIIGSGIEPGNICILARANLPKYVGPLIKALQQNNIKCRVEDPYQDLMKDELVMDLIKLLYLAIDHNAAEYWYECLNLMCALDGSDSTSEGDLYSAEQRLVTLIDTIRPILSKLLPTPDEVTMVITTITKELGTDRIRSHFRVCANPKTYDWTLAQFAKLLSESWRDAKSWADALNAFRGIGSIPAMTVHKSKGLEYHTVIFIGLEDEAWWNFASQTEEEMCTFFVAFSRAKKQVYFTFCERRSNGARLNKSALGSLFALLIDAGVTTQQIQDMES